VLLWEARSICTEENVCEACINGLEFCLVVGFQHIHSLKGCKAFGELVLVALLDDPFAEFSYCLGMFAFSSAMLLVASWNTCLSKKNLRVEVDAEEAMVTFNGDWIAKGVNPRTE